MTNDVLFCIVRPCSPCARRPETATVHVDCFKLFRERVKFPDTMNRLWIAASWSHPCPRNGVLLPPPSVLNPGQVRHLASEVCNFDRLKDLPLDICHEICDMLISTIFARLSLVMDIIDFITLTDRQDTIVMSLSNLQPWIRGSEPPIPRHAQKQMPSIRLVVDSRGLKRVEPPTTRLARRSHVETYAFVDASQDGQIMFKVVFLSAHHRVH